MCVLVDPTNYWRDRAEEYQRRLDLYESGERLGPKAALFFWGNVTGGVIVGGLTVLAFLVIS